MKTGMAHLERAVSMVFLLLTWMVLHDQSTAVPVAATSPRRTSHDVLGQCFPGTYVLELCQSCAKLTKLSKAYRMCCNDDPGNSTESVRSFCERLLRHSP